MTQTYIPEIWAVDGEVLAIPQETQEDGSLSYQQGYGERFQQKLGINPTALPYPRKQTNQLFNTLTGNQQSWMKYGLPIWVPASENLGVSLAYPLFAQVWYSSTGDDADGETYQNLVNGNTATPGTDATWLLTSGAVDGVQVGMSIPWNTIGSPEGRYLLEDGSAVSRTTYVDLYEKLCPLNNGTTTNASDLITNLDDTTAEYHIGMKLEGTGIPSGAYVIAIPGTTSVQMSTTATATGDNIDIRFFVWGNGDGSTTFNIPSMDGQFIAGSGSTGITWSGSTYNKVGQSFGEATYQLDVNDLPEHSHGGLESDGTDGNLFLYDGPSDGGTVSVSGGSSSFYGGTKTAGITGGTTHDSIPQIPPTKIKKWFIRY